MRRVLVVLAAAAAVVLAAPLAWALITPTRILTIPGTQWGISRNDTYYLYTSNSLAHPNHYDAFARLVSSGATTKLNAPGTAGYVGNFDPTTDTAIYQQVKKGNSDLYFFDLDTDTRSKVPDINSPSTWEAGGLVSASFVLFDRDEYRGKIAVSDLYLYDRAARTKRRIAHYTGRFVFEGSIGERFASWSVCTQTNTACNVRMYNVTTHAISGPPTPTGRLQYAPAVDETNDQLFYARSGNGCGLNVSIFSVPTGTPGTTPTKIASLPAGVDVYDASLWLDGVSYDLLLSAGRCTKTTLKSDVWSVPGVSPGP